jgi:hypothetical protein
MTGIGVYGRANIEVMGQPVTVVYSARVHGPASIALASVELTSVHIVDGSDYTAVNIGTIIQSDRMLLEIMAIDQYRALIEDDEEDRLLANDDTREMMEQRQAANDDGVSHA